MDFLNDAWFWIMVTACSELIGLNKKLKDNSIIELVFHVLMALKPKK
jgi:hypothetical protein